VITTEAMLAEILRHTDALADAAEGNLGVGVEHCPDWSVADLVAHVIHVHWWWELIARERHKAPPRDAIEPKRPADNDLTTQLRAGARRLSATLGAADPDTPVWTWAPQDQRIGFITRHQVQEAAVHHFDAANAAGLTWDMAPPMAADAVEEFLTYSMATDEADVRPGVAPLKGTIVLRATDTDHAWTITDGQLAGTVQFRAADTPDAPALEAASADLLLWLYRRIDQPLSSDDEELVTRFRALTDTD